MTSELDAAIERLEAETQMAERHFERTGRLPTCVSEAADLRLLLDALKRRPGRDAIKAALTASRGWPPTLHPGPAADAIRAIFSPAAGGE